MSAQYDAGSNPEVIRKLKVEARPKINNWFDLEVHAKQKVTQNKILRDRRRCVVSQAMASGYLRVLERQLDAALAASKLDSGSALKNTSIMFIQLRIVKSLNYLVRNRRE